MSIKILIIIAISILYPAGTTLIALNYRKKYDGKSVNQLSFLIIAPLIGITLLVFAMR